MAFITLLCPIFFHEYLSILTFSIQSVFFDVKFSRIFFEFGSNRLVLFQLNSFDDSVGMADINIFVYARVLFSFKACFES